MKKILLMVLTITGLAIAGCGSTDNKDTYHDDPSNADSNATTGSDSSMYRNGDTVGVDTPAKDSTNRQQ